MLMLKSFLTEFLGSSQNLKHFSSLKVLQHILNDIKPKIRVGMKLVIGVRSLVVARSKWKGRARKAHPVSPEKEATCTAQWGQTELNIIIIL